MMSFTFFPLQNSIAERQCRHPLAGKDKARPDPISKIAAGAKGLVFTATCTIFAQISQFD